VNASEIRTPLAFGKKRQKIYLTLDEYTSLSCKHTMYRLNTRRTVPCITQEQLPTEDG
jgi:hypothetical protein